MAALTRESDRGNALYDQMRRARHGVQNGTFNRRLSMASQRGTAELTIDGDGVSKLRFPPSTSIRIVGRLYVMNDTDGVVVAGAGNVFDYTFACSAANVLTITPNTAAVGFGVIAFNFTEPTAPIGNIDRAVTINGTGAVANRRFYLDATMSEVAMTALNANTRHVAAAALVQNGRS